MRHRWLSLLRHHPGLRAAWLVCLLLGVLRVPLPVLHEHAALSGLDARLAAHVAHCHPDAPADWLEWHWHWLCWEEWCEAEGLEPGTPWTASSEFETRAAGTLAADLAGCPPGEMEFGGELWSLTVTDQRPAMAAIGPHGNRTGMPDRAPGRVNPTSRTGLARC